MKYALITGASSGIGAACAAKFATAGCFVYIGYNKNAEGANSVMEKIKAAGGNGMIVKADISDEEQVLSMFSQISKLSNRLDVLINNAGVSESRLFSDITKQQWENLFAVNVTGSFLCAREAVKLMVPKKSGRIINISSIWGIAGASCEVHYSASKAAIIGMTKALAKEVAPSGITVNCIAPGVIDTAMNACLSECDILALKEQTPLGAVGKAIDIAALALFLAGEGGDFMTGQVISPNGGIVI